jgi:hypothetical protein
VSVGVFRKGSEPWIIITSSPMGDPNGIPGLDKATIAAIGPKPYLVGISPPSGALVEAQAAEWGRRTAQDIAAAVRKAGATGPLRVLAIEGFSAGCRVVRGLWMGGVRSLAWMPIDGVHGEMVTGDTAPKGWHLGFARSLAREGIEGRARVSWVHTYIVTEAVKPPFWSTRAMLEAASDLALLPAPPDGETRVTDAGLLRVYSHGGADAAAHRRAATLRPRVFGDVIAELLAGGAQAPELLAAPPSSSPASPPSSSPASPPSSSPPKRVALVGDSLAQGLGPQLAAIAERAGVAFTTKGKQSTRVHQWVIDPDLGPAVGSPPADLVLVCLGTNDMRTASPELAGAEAGALADKIAGMGASVAWIGPPRLTFDTGAFRPALARACAERNVRIFDSTAVDFERSPDGIHATAQGYRTWAEEIAAWVPITPSSSPPSSSPPSSSPPSSSPPGELRAGLLAVASGELHRSPPVKGDGKHKGERIQLYMRGQIGNWCAAFVSWCLEEARRVLGLTAPIFPYTLRVSELAAHALAAHRLHKAGDGYAPKPGDLAIYGRDGQNPLPPSLGGNAGIGHTDIVCEVLDPSGPSWRSISGNSDDAIAVKDRTLTTPALRLVAWVDLGGIQGTKTPDETPAASIMTESGPIDFERYVAGVSEAEYVRAFGNSAEPEAATAQAIWARTHATWRMLNENMGTAAKPFPNSPRVQVFALDPSPIALQAAKSSRGLVLWYGDGPAIGNFVAGAKWASGKPSPSDPTSTEKWVTYNAGRRGADVKPSPISRPIAANRGGGSQNGAHALAKDGKTARDISRFFFGEDIEFRDVSAPAPSTALARFAKTAPPPSSSPPASGGSSLPLLAVLARIALF